MRAASHSVVFRQQLQSIKSGRRALDSLLKVSVIVIGPQTEFLDHRRRLDLASSGKLTTYSARLQHFIFGYKKIKTVHYIKQNTESFVRSLRFHC